MKKIILMAVAVASFFVSCTKEKDVVQLVSKETYDGDLAREFEYDQQDRLTKLRLYSFGSGSSTRTPGYDESGNLISEKYITSSYTYDFKIEREGNVITFKEGLYTYYTITLNSLELPEKYESGSSTQTMTYDANGNMLTRTSGNTVTTYAYDKSKSPLYSCQTPKWYIACLACRTGNVDEWTTFNNVTSYSSSLDGSKPTVVNFDLQYDSGYLSSSGIKDSFFKSEYSYFVK